MEPSLTAAELLGQNIAARRESRGVSQRAMAKTLGIQQATLNKIELGQRSPTREQAGAIAQFLNHELTEVHLTHARWPLARNRTHRTSQEPPEAVQGHAGSAWTGFYPPHPQHAHITFVTILREKDNGMTCDRCLADLPAGWPDDLCKPCQRAIDSDASTTDAVLRSLLPPTPESPSPVPTPQHALAAISRDGQPLPPRLRPAHASRPVQRSRPDRFGTSPERRRTRSCRPQTSIAPAVDGGSDPDVGTACDCGAIRASLTRHGCATDPHTHPSEARRARFPYHPARRAAGRSPHRHPRACGPPGQAVAKLLDNEPKRLVEVVENRDHDHATNTLRDIRAKARRIHRIVRHVRKGKELMLWLETPKTSEAQHGVQHS